MIAFSQAAIAQTDQNSNIFTLEELSNVKVTTATKTPEKQFKAMQVVTVLTTEDIKRSGATSIPEALRFVPGLNVAQIDSSRWAVSARGFNRQYSNKLLVLIDGRSVYTPLFSGVFWDSQDTVMDNIDRIEVIRGPGATLWGSNAVNGVVNIITKKAQNTQGSYLSAIIGNQEKGSIEMRHGGQIDEDLFYRIYAKRTSLDELTNRSDQTGNDDAWDQHKIGFRVDSDTTSNTNWFLSGEAYTARIDQVQNFPGLVTTGVTTAVSETETSEGFHLLGNWEKRAFGSSHTIKSYIDYYQRDSENTVELKNLTLDVEYQNTNDMNARNQLIWGTGFRHVRDSLESVVLANGQPYLEYYPG